MKIAFLSPFNEESAGTNRLQNFSNSLNRLGNETKVFCLGNYSGIFHYKAYDLIHVLKPHYRSGLPAYLLRKFGFFRRAILDFDDIDWLILEERGRFWDARISKFLESLLTNRFDGIIAGNDILADYLYEKVGTRKEKVMEIIPNGVDTRLFSPRKRETGLRKHYKIFNSKLITYVGTLASVEQISPILKGFRAISNKYDNVKLMIVGDGNAKEELVGLAHSLGIHKKMVFTGRVDHKRIPNYLGESDVLIHIPFSPRTASFANPSAKGPEYMAMEKPIIGANCGYAPVMLDGGKAAFLINTPEPLEVLRAYEEIINNPKEAKKRAKRARQLAVERYDWDILARRLEKAYERV